MFRSMKKLNQSRVFAGPSENSFAILIPPKKISERLTFSRLLDKIKNNDSLEPEQPTGWRSRPQEQTDRVKELFTVHSDARVRNASKQQHWTWDGLEYRSAVSMLISREHRGAPWRTLWPCRSVPLSHEHSPNWLFKIQGTSVLESVK